MALLARMVFALLMVDCFTSVLGGLDVGRNLTHFMRHRERRGLIFENGGVAKIILGPVFPIQLGDPISWRSILALINFHVGDFKIPDKPLYPWDKWETLYARSQSYSQHLEPDASREFVYTAVEFFMNKTHGSGRTCLLRLICENAQVHHHIGIFGEILNVILTPGKEDLEAVYEDAYQMGRNGIDCIQYYSKCPRGFNLFDQFIEEY